MKRAAVFVMAAIAGVLMTLVTVIGVDRGANLALYFLMMLIAGLGIGLVVPEGTWVALTGSAVGHVGAFIGWAPFAGDHDGLALLYVPLVAFPGLVLATVAARLSGAHQRLTIQERRESE